MIHVGNQNAELASVQKSEPPASSAPAGSSMIDTSGGAKGGSSKPEEAKKPVGGRTNRCHHIATQKCVHCMSSAIQEGEEKKQDEEQAPKGKCNHASTSHCPNCIGKTASIAPAKRQCRHGPNQKCPNCLDQEEGMVKDRKHDPFDGYIKNMKKKCAKSHSSTQKCQNCTFSQNQRYTVDYNCKYHPPYPQGSCQRCIP